MASRFGIIGSGGQADETESYAPENSVAFRAVDQAYLNKVATVDVNSPSKEQEAIPVVAALGAPGIRREMVGKWPGSEYVNVISDHAVIDKTATLLQGCIIAPLAVVTTNVEIGEHVLINVGATVSHDSRIGDYATISPGANIAGNVVLGKGVFIGIGATVSNGIKIADGVVVGAGAVVIRDIEEENAAYAGVPAKKINQNEGWLREL